MYGRFTTTQLQKYAMEQGARLRREQQQKKEQKESTEDDFKTYDSSWLGPVKSRFIGPIRPVFKIPILFTYLQTILTMLVRRFCFYISASSLHPSPYISYVTSLDIFMLTISLTYLWIVLIKFLVTII